MPASVAHVAVRHDDVVYGETLSGPPRKTTAGDLLVARARTSNGWRLGGFALADAAKSSQYSLIRFIIPHNDLPFRCTVTLEGLFARSSRISRRKILITLEFAYIGYSR